MAKLASKIGFRIGLLGLALVVSAENACQKDYKFCPQCSVSGANTATPTPTEDDGVVPGATPTPTPSTNETPTPTPSSTDSGTPTPTPSATPTSVNPPVPLLRALESANEEAASSSTPHVDAESQEQVAMVNQAMAGNWLGKAYIDEEVPGAALDSDGDGFTDKLEQDWGTGIDDPASFPNQFVTSLATRFRGKDDDMDGLENARELELGTNPAAVDSDADGRRDFTEVLSATDPTLIDANSWDRDQDGLSDGYENSAGLDPDNADSDSDRLSDEMELALGANPLANDSDQDGILDGKEFQMGSDPTIPEWQPAR